MGTIEWSPEEINLGSYNVEVDAINTTVTATYVPEVDDEDDDDIVIKLELLDYAGLSGITVTQDGTAITLSGIVPIGIFEGHQLTYVDKGSSDKLMTPVICNISDVPDHKDIFRIDADNRANLTYTLHFKATTFYEIEAEITYMFVARQTLDRLRYWTNDYFQHRY